MDFLGWIHGLFFKKEKGDLTLCRTELNNCLAEVNIARARVKEYEAYSDRAREDKRVLQDEIARLRNRCGEISENLEKCNREKIVVEAEIGDLRGQILRLQKKLEDLEKLPEEARELYMDWNRQEVVYEKRYVLNEYRQKVYIPMEPREYITTQSKYLEEVVARAYNLYHPKSEREVVGALWSVLKDDRGLRCVYRDDWVHGTITGDFWQLAGETIKLQGGDCEDFSILFTSLCAVAGVPLHRVGVFLGYYGETCHAWAQYWDPIEKRWLLIEGTQSHAFNSGLEYADSKGEYEAYLVFNALGEWRIKEGATFGAWVEERDDWNSWELMRDWIKLKINGVRRWLRLG